MAGLIERPHPRRDRPRARCSAVREFDATADAAAAVVCPTLVVHLRARSARARLGHARTLAASIAGAQLRA